jgi:ribosomal protein S18 acetylase RimI-like enzyme
VAATGRHAAQSVTKRRRTVGERRHSGAGYTHPRLHEILRQGTATPGDGPFVLGAFESTLAGIVGVIRASATSARIWGFYVKPESRGRGIGRSLMQRAIDIVRQMPDVVSVELGVSSRSSAARHVYIAQGFRDTRFDAETDTHYMALELAADAG